MTRGGSKPGERRGGRKPGTRNKASAARQAEVAGSGVTPLEVMLANMRFHHRQAEELLELLSAAESPEAKIQILGEASRHRQMAQDCAKEPPTMCIRSLQACSTAATPIIRPAA